MASHITSSGIRGNIFHDYKQVWLMAGGAVLLSAMTIIYYSYKWYNEQIEHVVNKFEMAAITLMPYMISAVVAAITTIAIREILPILKSARVTRHIQTRVKLLAEGDLTTVSRLECDNEQLKEIATQLNYAIGFIGSSIAQWKIINRQQWDLLENIRHATAKGEHGRALKMIEKMEENWRMTATIESRFKT
ncbi:MAG: hypothetical protein JSV52_09405 [Candidatus Zixiibacteriota bacterium]|nr:MAG: hypothetical protein JSV52_09405 [candidate division Zixibacteria bacterium]